MKKCINLFDVIPSTSNNEIFVDLLKNDNTHIEKIISYGQVTPIDEPYIQSHDEWVVVLKGMAKLRLDNNDYILDEGEHLFIPKNTKHWVTYTENPTIWLALHLLI
ncbi:cupin domain-containing protein [Francisella philomiragia]|uniref:Cupin type-2 domain-containing protein n=1 Tax=Francisella philomiragia subsp. philomiragia (strain ATCC 25017 / CCUG 19701 / FSC 153 / O\|nr:cupin domain-containing protein [Francisella philomiragia]AJI47536.1 mannose-6-phosphate isomerase family protein [Francisella philomiragia]AJI50068.1 mannose-6-phosphate isomerase family protein [Francisella philomiragia]MBK2020743.1 cupin domain-containing protein [Francisella philomiragia]MBK2030837.1 cupin domain-containing protein [Francisella philomiragia]MBK2092355.1 cupin domain-containing protein [Francisella philomiragia]